MALTEAQKELLKDAYGRHASNLIPKHHLSHGLYYQGICRNAIVARWDAKRNKFRHFRTKFGSTFLEYIKHPEDELNFDVFVPEKQIDPTDPPIPLEP